MTTYKLVDKSMSEESMELFKSWFGTSSFSPRYKFIKEGDDTYSLWVDVSDMGWFGSVYKKFLEETR